MEQQTAVILTINCGSSSLKFALFHETDLSLVSSGNIRDIGKESSIILKDASGQLTEEVKQPVASLDDAVQTVIQLIRESFVPYKVQAIGHRIVQGGQDHFLPEKVTGSLLDYLEQLIPLVPSHLPPELTAIRAFETAYPDIPQVLCYDTAFHKDMPFAAKHFALPRYLWDKGIIRYGFHGLSYEYIFQQLQQNVPQAATGRTIMAHLGNGASMAVVHNGKSLDTTMGLTPAGGLVMSTRSGDIDPGVILYLLKEKHFIGERALNELLNKQAGLKGVSDGASDIQTLLEQENSDPKAAEALNLFCYQAKKYIGALAAAAGGIDTLVFTGGIGEHAPQIRERICEGLAFLGIQLDTTANEQAKEIISVDDAPVTIRIIPANEEIIIAQHTQQWLQSHLNLRL